MLYDTVLNSAEIENLGTRQKKFALKGVLCKTSKEQIENFGKNSVLILNVCSLEFLL